MGGPMKEEEATRSSFRAALTAAMDDVAYDGDGEGDVDEGEVEEPDWANLQILHHTAKLLETTTRQSTVQINALRQSLDEKEREVSELRDKLRTQEERERELLEQNRTLRLQMMAAASAPRVSRIEKGVQVSPPLSRYVTGCSAPLQPQIGHPVPGLAPRRHPLEGFSTGDDGEAVRLEAPPSTPRLPQGQLGQSRSISPQGAGGILNSRAPDIERQHLLEWRHRRRQLLARVARQNPDLDFGRNLSLPRMRPLIKRKNGMKHGGGEVVGYRWRHYDQHPFLRDPTLPPNPFLEEDEEEDEEETHEDNHDDDDDEDEAEDQQMQVVKMEEDDEEDDEELLNDEDDEELEEAEVLDVIDLVDDEEDEGTEEKKPIVSLLDVPKVKPVEIEKLESSSQTRSKNTTLVSKRENCMTTSKPYYVAEELDDHVADMVREQEAQTQGKAVEVPQWRHLVLNSIIRDVNEPEEEDISETALSRRHCRLELDEKRRKRWDSQRVREETYLEKLKRKMEEREQQHSKRRKSAVGNAGRKISGKANMGKGKIATATAGATNVTAVKGEMPVIKNSDNKDSDEETGAETNDLQGDILYIRVSEDIPISIFGHPMPIIEKAEFDLPWISRDDSPPPSSPENELDEKTFPLFSTAIKLEPVVKADGDKSDNLSPSAKAMNVVGPLINVDVNVNINPKPELEVSLNPASCPVNEIILPALSSSTAPPVLTVTPQWELGALANVTSIPSVISPDHSGGHDLGKLNMTSWIRR